MADKNSDIKAMIELAGEVPEEEDVETSSQSSNPELEQMLSMASEVPDDEPINEEEYRDLSAGEAFATGMGNTLEAVSQPIETISGMAEGIAALPGYLGEQAREDPRQLAQDTFHNIGSLTTTGAGAVAGATAGAAMGSVVPVVGTAIGGVAGGAIGATAGFLGFEGLLGLAEFFTGKDVAQETDEVFEQAGEVFTGSALGGTAGKALGATIKGVDKARRGVQSAGRGAKRVAADMANRRSVARKPTDQLMKAIAPYGPAKKELDRIVNKSIPRLGKELTALQAVKGKAPIPEGQVFQYMDDMISKGVEGQPAILDKVGGELYKEISKSRSTFNIEEANRLVSKAITEQFDDVSYSDLRSPITTQVKKKVLEPFEIAAAKKLGYEVDDILKFSDKKTQLAKIEKELLAKTKTVSKLQARNKTGRASKALLERESASLEALKNRATALTDEITEFDFELKGVELSPVEFWETTKKAVKKIKWEDSVKNDGNAILKKLRKSTQEKIADGLDYDPRSLAKYRALNEEYYSFSALKEILEKAAKPEFLSVGDPNTSIRNALENAKKFVDVTRAAPGKALRPIDHIRTMSDAFTDGVTKPGVVEKFARYISPVLPGGAIQGSKGFSALAKNIDEWFSPTNAALLQRTLIATDEFMRMNQGELSREGAQIVGAIPQFRQDLQEAISAAQAGIGRSDEEKRAILSSLLQNPGAGSFVPTDENSGSSLMKGVRTFNGEPIARRDVERYFANVAKSGLDNYEKAKRRKHFNREGRFMEEPSLRQEPKPDYAAVDKGIQREKAIEEIQKFRSSRDVVKMSKTSSQVKSQDLAPALRLVSFNGDTAMGDFEEAFDVVLGNEGGYSNNPNDRGGATNFGVTQKTYNSYLRRNGQDRKDVSDITEEEVQEIYREFWDDVSGDDLPWPLNTIVFDAAINSGPSRAAKQLQSVLGVKRDGRIGEETLGAIEASNVQRVARDFLDVREEFYQTLASDGGSDDPDKTFIRGWKNRVKKMKRLVNGSGQTRVA